MYDVIRTSLVPSRIITSTMTAPTSIRPNPTHATADENNRLFRSVDPTKYSTAISKFRSQKISMLRPWSVRMR